MTVIATRHERVVIDLDDRFTRPMAGMAASMSLFRKNIDDSDRSVVKFDRTTTDVGRSVDRLSGRLKLAADVAATLGPAIVPSLTATVPLLAGLTNQLGFSVIAGGSAILAFQGVGDALKAVNEAHLHPTTANLEKMREAMSTLGRAGQDFVIELQSMRPAIQQLQNVAQDGMFPGMERGIEQISTRLPQVERIIGVVSRAVGDLTEKSGTALGGPEWDDFFNMIESEGRPTLMALGESIGNLTRGMAELWIAFAPLNRDFSKGFLQMSQEFAKWADGLSATEGFQEFIDYLHETGPQVGETLGALANAILQIGEAVAPLGGPALRVIEAFSDAIASIANSDLGTPIFAGIAAWRAYSMAVALASKAQAGFNRTTATSGAAAKGGLFSGYASSLLGVTSAQERAQTAAGKTSATISAQRAAFAKGAAGAALLGVAMSGAADNIGLTNTAMLGLTGFMVGGPLGAGIGATAGAFLDLKNAGDGLESTITRLNAAAASGDWSSLKKNLSDAKKQIDDISKSDGSWGDLFSDAIKGTAATLQGRGFTKNQIAKSYKKDLKPAADAKAAAESAAAMRKSAVAAQLAARGYTLVGQGAREASMSVTQFATSVDNLSRGLGRQGALDAYKSSLLDLADAVKENGKTLSSNTRAGLANRAALRGIASSALEASKSMQNVGRAETFLQRARRGFIASAMAAGATREAARRLADQFGLVDRIHAKPKVTEIGSAEAKVRIAKMRAEIARLRDKKVGVSQRGAEEASARIAALQRAINALHGKTVTTYMVTQAIKRGPVGHGGPAAQADGGTVGGQRDPYGDKVLTYLAPGEEVISNRFGQADRHRELLRSINANRLADGGTASAIARAAASGGSRSYAAGAGGALGIDYDQLARTLVRSMEGQRPIMVTEAVSASATAQEIARQQAFATVR